MEHYTLRNTNGTLNRFYRETNDKEFKILPLKRNKVCKSVLNITEKLQFWKCGKRIYRSKEYPLRNSRVDWCSARRYYFKPNIF